MRISTKYLLTSNLQEIINNLNNYKTKINNVTLQFGNLILY